ncbi:MAG: SDR family oxidoreductase [Gemmatimonadota bacterium]|nr:SDR family oxidoreductase [Gemmatimonadota bacterium]
MTDARIPADREPSRFLTDTHAIVTGGGRGIGAAVAEELARLGASVTILGRTMKALEAQRGKLEEDHGVRALAIECDVSVDGQVAAAVDRARAELGAPYVLVNNAGQAVATTLGELARDTWDRVLAVNLTGTFLCTRAVLPGMLAAGAGRIVNIASTAGLRGYARMSAYCAAKHGVVGLTRALAMETAKTGVTVNSVCPGYTDTDMAQAAIENLVRAGRTAEEARAMVVRVIPRGLLTRPEEVASAVGWLCSPPAAAVTGVALPVSGGEVT